MSRSKRWIALLLSLVLAFSAVSFALAEDEGEEAAAETAAEPEEGGEEGEEELVEPLGEDDPEAVPPSEGEELEMEGEEIAEEVEEAVEGELPAAEAEAAEPEAVEEPAVVRVACNLRREPAMSLAHNIWRNMSKGDKVTVIAFLADGWCKVRYGTTEGYLQTSWVKFPNKTIDEIPAAAVSAASVNDDNTGIIHDTEGRGQFPEYKPTEEPVEPDITFTADRSADVVPTGIEVGESDTDEVQYVASTRKKFSIKAEPSTTSRSLTEIKKGKRLLVLAYGDEWCKVSSWNGQYIGWMKQKNVFHYHSMDPFRFDIPWYDSYKPTGYIIATKPFRITDHENKYKGQQVQAGDVICVQLREDGGYNILLRRDWVTVPAEYGEYHPFVSWDKAKAGDMIGGFTLYYGIGEGGYWAKNRAYNIGLALKNMDKVIVGKGKKYSFLTNVEATRKNGYRVAGIIGGNGRGIGGGICHTSSLTYIALLSIPSYIYEREPHTDAGVFYIPLEFDATVGGWSDMIYYNILPYDIEHHSFHNPYNGTMTLMFECLETRTEEEIRNWNWKTDLRIPKAKDEGG